MKSVSTRRARLASTTSSSCSWNRSRKARSTATDKRGARRQAAAERHVGSDHGVEAADAVPGRTQHGAGALHVVDPRAGAGLLADDEADLLLVRAACEALQARDAASALAATATAVVCGITVGSTKPPE